jgi:hypothetical protein
MYPETYAARKGLLGIGHHHGRHFNQTMVHEGYEVNMTSDMPDTDTLNLRLEFLNLDGTKHSVADNFVLNLCFPPGYKPTTGPYVLHNTNLVEQMAGMKRSHKSEDIYIPTAKRRVAHGGQGGKNHSSGKLNLFLNLVTNTLAVTSSNNLIATPLRRGGDTGARKPVIMDLSGGEDRPDTLKSVTAIMKRLPPDSMKGDFPRFKEGAVYIIIDPKSSIYQYRLHKTTLSRLSPIFAKALQLPCPEEAMEEWKIAAPGAQARFELTYNYKHGKWMLRRVVS